MADFLGTLFKIIFSFAFGWVGRALPWIAGFFGSTVVQVLISVG